MTERDGTKCLEVASLISRQRGLAKLGVGLPAVASIIISTASSDGNQLGDVECVCIRDYELKKISYEVCLLAIEVDGIGAEVSLTVYIVTKAAHS